MLVIETTPRTYYTDMSSLGRVITQVPVEDLEFIWSQVKPQIEKALDLSLIHI